MLSRRRLLKAIGAAILAAAGGTALWRTLRRTEPTDLPPGPRPQLAFFLLSDIHMSSTDSAMAERLHLALKDLTAFNGPIDTIVLGGDQVDGGRQSDYDALKEIMAEYDLPEVHGLMGNHEYYDIWYNAQGEWSTATGPHGKTDAQSRERFLRFMGYDRPYHDTWVNKVHLIMLSQETYVQERPEVGEGAWYSDEQLAWLAETLKPHADGSLALVFIHQPLPPPGSNGGSHRLIRATEFREILAPYRNVIVLSGHTHRSLETEGRYTREATFHWFQNASVGKTRGAASVARPVQGLYIQVYPDRVVLRGREFSNGTWIKGADWTVELAGSG